MGKSEDKIIWTVGHSTHDANKFLEILKSAGIELIADVRSLPGSRRFPQFNKENLISSLHVNSIDYIHIQKLGGRRKVKKDSINTAWQHPAFRGFADYMETTEFTEGISELISTALNKRTAIMCAEVLWWRCHRSLISDYLKLNGWKVLHIVSANKIEEHPYTKPARIVNSKLNYTLVNLFTL